MPVPRLWTLPRPRFTVRRLMVAVALTACLLELILVMRSRSRTFRARARLHLSTAATLNRWHHPPSPSRVHAGIEYHIAQYVKYKRAAFYPWLPVARDSPEPPR